MKKKKTKTAIFPRSMDPLIRVRSCLPCLVVSQIMIKVAVMVRQRPSPTNCAVMFGTSGVLVPSGKEPT